MFPIIAADNVESNLDEIIDMPAEKCLAACIYTVLQSDSGIIFGLITLYLLWILPQFC